MQQNETGKYVGTIDLGGADGGTNTVACSNSIEGGTPPGVSVLNKSTQTLNASHVSWDSPAPDLFECNAGLNACSCEISTCSVDAGADGMDAVYESTGIIDTTGNQLSTLDCTPARRIALRGGRRPSRPTRWRSLGHPVAARAPKPLELLPEPYT